MQSRLNAVAALALLAGYLIGAGGMQALHAQQKPRPLGPCHSGNRTDELRRRCQRVRAARKLSPGRKRPEATCVGPYGSVSGRRTARPAYGLVRVGNLDAIKAAHTSLAYLEARKVGDQYARLRILAIEGL
jgi:hypothetical protein